MRIPIPQSKIVAKRTACGAVMPDGVFDRRAGWYSGTMSVSAFSDNRLFPVLLLLLVGGGWGAVPALARLAVTGGIQPMGYVFWVGAGAALVCWCVCLLRGVRPRFTRRHLIYYLLSGCSRIVIAGFVMYTVLGHVPAGVVAIILGTSPLMTFAASVAMRSEGFSLRRGMGVLLGLAGIVLMFGPSTGLPADTSLGWVALGFVTPVIYAFSNITIDRTRPAGEDSMALTAGMFALVAALALPLSLAMGHFHPVWTDGLSLPELAMFIHAAIIAVCFFGLFELIRRAGATYGSQSTYVTTLSGILYGMVLLGERPSLWTWAAAICILAGVAIVNSSGRGARGGGGGDVRR